MGVVFSLENLNKHREREERGERKMKGVAAVVAATIAWVNGAIPEHRVHSLPGFQGTLPVESWSGYIEVDLEKVLGRNGTANVHYWLVKDARGRDDAPTISWNQGGPGGSSMIGLWTENGPFTVNDFSFQPDGGFRVFENPHSWHHLGNLLYFEHPAPTGFSTCSPIGACQWDDSTQALVSYAFLVEFFKAYPELAPNKFYMSGESYAGVLVPSCVQQIIKHRTPANEDKAPWNIKGIALGNACPGNRVYTCTPYSGWIGAQVAVDFRFYHGMISEETYEKIQEACKNDWGAFGPPKSKECLRLLEDPIRPCMSEAGDTYDMGGGYFLYDTCKTDLGVYRAHSVDVKSLHKQVARQIAGRGNTTWFVELSRGNTPRPNSGEYFCGQERAALIYLNRRDVQDAIHVDQQEFQFQTSLVYNFTWHSLLPLYRSLLIDELDILQYSGDADPCVVRCRYFSFFILPLFVCESMNTDLVSFFRLFKIKSRTWAPKGGSGL